MTSVRIGVTTLSAVVAAVVFVAAAAAAEKTGMVQGEVRLDGKPIAEGQIAFHPEEGKPIRAKIKDGEFEFKKVPAGKYKLTFKAKGVPPKFADPKITVLKVSIEEGKNRLNFNLISE